MSRAELLYVKTCLETDQIITWRGKEKISAITQDRKDAGFDAHVKFG